MGQSPYYLLTGQWHIPTAGIDWYDYYPHIEYTPGPIKFIPWHEGAPVQPYNTLEEKIDRILELLERIAINS